MEKLVTDNRLYKLTKKVRVQLVSAVRCAIRVRSKQRENKELSSSAAVSLV